MRATEQKIESEKIDRKRDNGLEKEHAENWRIKSNSGTERYLGAVYS